MNRLTTLAQQLQGIEIQSIRELGEGVDHLAFEVNDVFIVRQRKQQDEDSAAAVEREIRLLAIVARVSPIPVPEVITADPARGLLVLRKLEGTSLFDEPCPDPMSLVEPLARFQSCVHGLPAHLVEPVARTDAYGLTAWLADAAAGLSNVAAVLSRDDRRIVEAFLDTAPPAEPAVVACCQNDLGAEHLLASPDRSTLTGVIDWSDAAMTDPARDLGRLYRDLGPAVAARIFASLEYAADAGMLSRAAFYARCTLLEDLAYGLTPGHRRYAERAMAHLRRTFATA